MCLCRGTAGVAHQDSDNYLGDHATPHGNEGSAGEEADLLNNCYVLYCTRLMGKISAVLGAKTSSFLAPFDTTHKPNVCQDRLGDQHNIGKVERDIFLQGTTAARSISSSRHAPTPPLSTRASTTQVSTATSTQGRAT